ncbi:MAG: CocE/NonD family hydrolase [Balneolaceae bacterium]
MSLDYKRVTSYPHKVVEEENVWIKLRDGTRLGARIWMPETANEDPVPAILEYIPYRKRDLTRPGDNIMHRYFAGHGYACLRVDMRGSGDSGGVLTDEYLETEQEDGIEIIDWIVNQSWCSGEVGMIGISWGGFNSLQIATHQPSPLKAIISACSTDDRYSDDVHYMGGCLLGDNLSWASTMFSRTTCPPDPAIVGDRWKKIWLDRLRQSGLWLKSWLKHQRKDEYWKHGSVNKEFHKILCPVMAVSGWADGYSNAVFRLLAGLEIPRQGLIGPWGHRYPHLGEPGPAIGFLQECLRWWDRWLKGIETGIMDEPMLRVWRQDSIPPVSRYTERSGRWIGEKIWPSKRIRVTHYPLSGDNKLIEGEDVPASKQIKKVQSPLSVGLFAGKWCSYGGTPDLPGDQREEDGGSLIYETGPLSKTIEILGSPVLDVECSVDRPVAMIAVRLSDVAPDGKATRVTFGILNLTHRESHENPEMLKPDKKYHLQVQLNGIAQQFPAGNRIRISISTSYWPIAWPPPRPVTLTVFPKKSKLILPERPPDPDVDDLIAFDEPEGAESTVETVIEPPEHNWKVIRDLARNISTLKVIKDEGIKKIEDIDLQVENRTTEWYSIRDDSFSSPRGEVVSVQGFSRNDWWNVRIRTRTVLTSDENNFRIQAELDAYDGDYRFYSNSWDESIPRDMV